MEQFIETFFSWQNIKDSAPSGHRGVQDQPVADVRGRGGRARLGLVLALLRGTRGRATAPLCWLAVGYIDLFRAVPGIVLIYMIGFGIPIAGVPWLGTWSQYGLAALALTVLYGAYVAEVYRAGIEGIYWSQAAASRSLGLSQAQTMASWSCPRRSAGLSRR